MALDQLDVTKAGPAAKVPSEIGVTGIRHFGGVLDVEFLAELAGTRGIQVYREMVTDPVVAGVLMAIDNLIRRVEWTFDPYSDKAEDRKWAEFMQTVIDDMSSSWLDTISSIFSMLAFGWSYHEIVYKKRDGYKATVPDGPASSDHDDGLWGWKKLPIRSQESLLRWNLDDNGGVRGMYQMVPPGVGGESIREIPIQNAALFRTSTYNESPEGRSLLRAAYRPWYFKRRLEEYEAIGIERDLAGLPHFKVPSRIMTSDATAPEKALYQLAKDLVTNVKRNHQEGLVTPSDHDPEGNLQYEFTLLSSGGARTLDIDKAITRKNQEIAICCLADWLLLGHDAVGSKALGSSKIDVMMVALETWTRAAADVVNAHAIPRLMVVNGADPQRSPNLRPGSVTQVEMGEFVTAVRTAVDGGFLHPDADLEDYAREVLGVPPRDPDAPDPYAVDPNTGFAYADVGAGVGPDGGPNSEMPGGDPNAGDAGPDAV